MKKPFMAAVAMVLSVTGMAQSTFEEGGLMYMEDLSDPSKMAVVVIPKKNPATFDEGMYSGNIVVPATIEHDLDTYNVIGIHQMAFYNCPNLVELDIQLPLKVLKTYISGDNIKKIKFPDSLESFEGGSIIAPNLEELYLGKNIKSIANISTSGKMEKLNLPESLESITNCFYKNEKLKSINITGGKLSKLENSFNSIPAVESINISGKNLDIYSLGSGGCDNLKTCVLSGEKTISFSFQNSPIIELKLSKGLVEIKNSFDNFNGTELVLPEGLTKISFSFKECPNLESLKLPESLTELERESFTKCPALKVLNISGPLKKLGSETFIECPALESFTWTGDNAKISFRFNDCPELKECILSGVSEILSAFKKFNGTELVLPNTLSKLSGESFEESPNLKVVRMSKGVCTLGNFCQGNGETIYCPWEEVPRLTARYHEGFSVTFVVPEGMEAKYREAWSRELKYRFKDADIKFREEKF